MNKFKSGDIVQFAFSKRKMRILQPTLTRAEFYDVQCVSSETVWLHQNMSGAHLIESSTSKKGHPLTKVFK